MEKPLILDANICGCAFTGPTAAAFVAISAAGQQGCLAAAAVICNAPVVGIVLTGGWAV